MDSESTMKKSDPNVPAIEFRNVDFFYDDKKVLDNLSFELGKREIKIILSGSGGGKSTILRLVLGLLKPDAGQILVDGEDVTQLDETELQRIRDQIGMVFQEGAFSIRSPFTITLPIAFMNANCRKRTWNKRFFLF
jgi:ABC-type transporter Mla maintaining outer membrane lipid asymmetry ATPase subunit MlaF